MYHTFITESPEVNVVYICTIRSSRRVQRSMLCIYVPYVHHGESRGQCCVYMYHTFITESLEVNVVYICTIRSSRRVQRSMWCIYVPYVHHGESRAHRNFYILDLKWKMTADAKTQGKNTGYTHSLCGPSCQPKVPGVFFLTKLLNASICSDIGCDPSS